MLLYGVCGLWKGKCTETGSSNDGITSRIQWVSDACLCEWGQREKELKGAVLTGFLQITGSLTAVESNGAGRAESITGHNRFSHRLELGKAVLYCSADSWHRASTGKGAGSQKRQLFFFDKLVTHHNSILFCFSVLAKILFTLELH